MPKNGATPKAIVAKAIVIVLTLAASSLIIAGRAPSAQACIVDNDGDCYLSVNGTVTATAGLNVRAAPWGAILDTVPYNYSNVVDCYVQASDGSYWDWLYDSRIGRSGWVYDPYLYTAGNIYQQVDEMHEGNCGSIPLAMPANVAATAISTGAIQVTWTDTNSGSAQYVVSNGNVSSPDLAAGATSYTWSGLAPNTYMCFTVAAKESGEQSPWTSYACATTWNLSAPSNITTTVTGTSSIQVTWSDTNGGAAQYVVANGNTGSPDLAAGATSYTWTGLAAGTYMCFFVAAKQSGQQSAWSAQACATTWALSVPGYVTAAPAGTNAIAVSWTDTNGGASQYVVSDGTATSPDLPAGATHYLWTGLPSGATMCFTVAARQSGQQSAWSPSWCTTTPAYVNMGDSFSSGEGTFGPYDPVTNTTANRCHRSSNSYSGQYAGMSSYWTTVTNVACTGAVTTDIANDPKSPNTMNIPDKGQLAQVKYLNGNVGLVTLTIGANDLNVAGIVSKCLGDFRDNRKGTEQCILGNDEPKVPGFDQWFLHEIPITLVPLLQTVFTQIHKIAPNAQIVISTYPRIFPATYTKPCSEAIGPYTLWLITSATELQRFLDVTSGINDAIKTAAAGFSYVSVLDVENLFTGHELCTTTDPWVNVVKGYIPFGGYDQESLHPTTAGYAAWASALLNYLRL